jgi:hypothetical protein
MSAYVISGWRPVCQYREGEQCLLDGAQSDSGFAAWTTNGEDTEPTHEELVERLEKVAIVARQREPMA